MAGRPSSKKQNSKAKSGGSSSVFRRLGLAHASNVIVAAMFVLAFAGLGTWYIARSDAAGSGCVAHTYYEYGPTGTCVKTIQSMLDHFKYGPYTLKSGNAYDGVFGPHTYADVVRFQYRNYIKGGGGQVGSRTWYAMCGLASIQGYADLTDFTRAGCGSIWSGYVPG